MIPDGARLRDELLEAFPELRALPAPAWFVGGAIRDLILGRVPADVDLAASSGLAAAQALASSARGRIVPLGRERFPTWRVILGDRACDISDVIGAGIEDDLARRDFTINAIALPLDGAAHLIDPFGGVGDIEARIVRMVSRQNLADDPLRILKAARLAATLGFEVEPETLRACAAEAALLSTIAGERIGSELEMMFSGGTPETFGPLLRDTGIDVVLFGRPVPGAISRLAKGDPVAIWAAIFRDADGEELRSRAKKLRWPAALASEVSSLLRALREVEASGADPERIDAVLYDAGSLDAQRIIALAGACREEEIANAVRERLEVRGNELFSIEPLLDGDEIRAAAGVEAGPEVGRLKRELLLEQIAGRVRSKDEALGWIRARATGVNR